MINRVKSNKSNIMRTDDLESVFAVHKASVTESSAVSVESPCLRTDDLESVFAVRKASVTESSAVSVSVESPCLKPDGGEKEKSLERTAGVAESSEC